MPLDSLQRFPVMALTQDNLPLSHQAQADRLCRVGAQWIQLRVKSARPEEWREIAHEVAAICRRNRAIFIINDNVDLALEVDADGVHLGKEDLDWAEARRRLGPSRLLGGTINNFQDVARARDCGCLDYVGVGPLRFTANKRKLAPVLGLPGVTSLLAVLEDLPAWVIGGVETSDLPELRAVGAAGVAVSSALYRGEKIEENFQAFLNTWARAASPASVPL